MPSTLYAVAALLPAAVLGSGLVIPEDNRMVQEDGLVRYPLVPLQGGSLFGKNSNITKRQIGTDTFTQQSGTLYTINLVLGTPGQTVPVQFDTGSAELWVNPVCSKSTTPDFCNAQPRFTKSSTLVDLGQKNRVKYGTGYADFEYVHDYVSIGSAKITQQVFGVAQDSAHAVVGIMGAGPDLHGWENGYPLVIDSLAKQGLTNSRAFGLDLRGFDSARGSVVFGGIDTKKYKGKLVKRPIIPAAQSPDGLTRYWVYLNGISVNQPDGKVVQVYNTPAGGKGQPVLLDSGYTLSALPSPIFDKLLAAFPSAVHVPSSDVYVVDCADPGKGGSLDFTFGDTVINARYYDFVWHMTDGKTCVLGAFKDDEFPVLGDTFLRSAYVVYDWDNQNIWLAQSDDCGSHLVPIGKGPDAVPDVPGECGQPPATSTTSTTSSSTAPPSTSTTSVSTTTKASTTSSKPASTSGTSTSTVTGSSTTASRNATASSTSPSSSTASGSSTSSGSTSSPPSSHTGTTTSPATLTRTTITYTTHTTKTITSCPPSVTHCPAHHVTVTTEIITATTAICPETTGTYTFTRTVTESGSTKPATYTVTVSPAPSQSTPAVVPGCKPGVPTACASCTSGRGPAPTASGGLTTVIIASRPEVVVAPTSVYGGGKNGTLTTTATGGPKPTQSVVVAGAGRVGLASGLLGVGAVIAVMGL